MSLVYENEWFACSVCGITDIFPARRADGSPLCLDCARGYCSAVGFPLRTMLIATVALFAVATVIQGVWWPAGIVILFLWLTCGSLHALIQEVLK